MDEILDQAAKSGRWDLVHQLFERMSSHPGWSVSSNVITHEAVYQNQLEELKWAIANAFWLGEVKLNRSPESEWPQRKEVLLYLLQRDDIAVRAVVRQAAEAGDISFLEWFLVHNQPNFPSEAMFAAAGAGQLEVVKYLYEEYYDDPNVELFREGDVILPRQVREDNFFRPSTTMDVAARNGHLHVLQFLQEIERHSAMILCPGQHPRCTSAAMDAAAARGHLDVLKWLHIHRSEGCTTKAMDLAASRRYHIPFCLGSSSGTCCLGKVPSSFYVNQLEVVQWLHANRSEGCTDIAMDGAASNGDFTMLKWLHFNTSATCTHRAVEGAATLGRLDIVQWLELTRMVTVSPTALVYAAANGHLDVVQWLHKEGWSTSEVMKAAAANGHLHVMQWLDSV
ncbi:putative ankyrin repeat protein [Phytophthora citrophthora]|uniref:Ankyrin repeat protein n=1 Tax=Phytophthora citrophthora TaxID=4793 RepID=A0AAD9GUE3_9STRA|nr:putative ankyrin repeat protein [Phytophthora citrophthora]